VPEDGDRTRVGTAVEAAAARANPPRAAFRTGLDVRRRDGRSDAVTDADRETRRRAVAAVRKGCPDEPIVGEERDGAKTVPDAGLPG